MVFLFIRRHLLPPRPPPYLGDEAIMVDVRRSFVFHFFLRPLTDRLFVLSSAVSWRRLRNLSPLFRGVGVGFEEPHFRAIVPSLVALTSAHIANSLVRRGPWRGSNDCLWSNILYHRCWWNRNFPVFFSSVFLHEYMPGTGYR